MKFFHNIDNNNSVASASNHQLYKCVFSKDHIKIIFKITWKICQLI